MEFTTSIKLDRQAIRSIIARMLNDYNEAAYDLMLTEWENDPSELQAMIKLNVRDYGMRAPASPSRGEIERRICELARATELRWAKVHG